MLELHSLHCYIFKKDYLKAEKFKERYYDLELLYSFLKGILLDENIRLQIVQS